MLYRDAHYWIKKLHLKPHPEGGYFREIYRSKELIAKKSLPLRFDGDRCFLTSIYFLLQKGEFSALHRLKSDELWYFHDGATLSIYVIYENALIKYYLGLNVNKGEKPQVVIPAGAWFGAIIESEGDFTLVGCAVAPGFDFADFELGNRTQLIDEYPHCREIIEKLTRI